MTRTDKSERVFSCTSCLALSTRPRITFDQDGRCNACQWAEQKRNVDWLAREAEFTKLVDACRTPGQVYDCVVPVSGGKDGSHVAWTLQSRFGLNPLCISVKPPLPTPLGRRNLDNFAASGFNLLEYSISPEIFQLVNKSGLETLGFPYYGWLGAIHSIVIRLSYDLGIGLIVYGEDGEVEYGGTSETRDNPIFSADYIRKTYLSSGFEQLVGSVGLPSRAESILQFPTEERCKSIKLVHWSYFEDWDPYRNYITAKTHCGLVESEATNEGTFTNFAQNDQVLYQLHTYIMFLKFGFGRANQDACIEIRRGAMTREQGLSLVRAFDGRRPTDVWADIATYFGYSHAQLTQVVERWANHNILCLDGSEWVPQYDWYSD